MTAEETAAAIKDCPIPTEGTLMFEILSACASLCDYDINVFIQKINPFYHKLRTKPVLTFTDLDKVFGQMTPTDIFNAKAWSISPRYRTNETAGIVSGMAMCPPVAVQTNSSDFV